MREFLFGGEHLPFWFFSIRAFFLYLTLILVTRWIGHRQVGILSGHNYLIAAGIVSLAGVRMVNPETSLISGLIIIVMYAGICILLARLELLQPFRVDREPISIIDKGKVLPDNLVKTRITLEELLALLRMGGYPRISDVQAAVFEPTGKLSVIKKEAASPITRNFYGLPSIQIGLTILLIQKGQVNEEGLKRINKDQVWLRETLTTQYNMVDWNGISAILVEPDGTLIVVSEGEKNK